MKSNVLSFHEFAMPARYVLAPESQTQGGTYLCQNRETRLMALIVALAYFFPRNLATPAASLS